MATTTSRRRRTRTTRDAAAFLAIMAARHGVPAPRPSRMAATAPRTAQDTQQAQDHLPSLEARQ